MTRKTVPTDLIGLLENELGLDHIRQRGDEVWASCPSHHDSGDSWSINVHTGMHSCFSCRYRGSLLTLILDNTEHNIFTGKRLMREYGINDDLELPELEEPEGFEDTRPKPVSELGIRELPMPPREAMAKRHLEPLSVMHYGVRWRDDKDAWILPIRSPGGVLMGWQEKSGDMVRNRPLKVEKKRTVFGAEHLSFAQQAMLVESPLDCVYMHGLGYSHVYASFGAVVSDEQLTLLHQYSASLLIALDNDEAGEANTRAILEKRLPWPVCLMNYDNTEAKDPGEMSPEELEWALKRPVPSSVWAVNHSEKQKEVKRGIQRHPLSLPSRGSRTYGGAAKAPRRLRDGTRQDRHFHRGH